MSTAPSPPAAPLSHPAMFLALAVLAACVLIGGTFVSSDTDFSQHLAVGRAMWSEHRLPMTNE